MLLTSCLEFQEIRNEEKSKKKKEAKRGRPRKKQASQNAEGGDNAIATSPAEVQPPTNIARDVGDRVSRQERLLAPRINQGSEYTPSNLVYHAAPRVHTGAADNILQHPYAQYPTWDRGSVFEHPQMVDMQRRLQPDGYGTPALPAWHLRQTYAAQQLVPTWQSNQTIGNNGGGKFSDPDTVL